MTTLLHFVVLPTSMPQYYAWKWDLKIMNVFDKRSSTCLFFIPHREKKMESYLKLNGSGWFVKQTSYNIKYVMYRYNASELKNVC